MTEPLPNCFSICPSAAVSAFLRLSSIAAVLSIVAVLSESASGFSHAELSHNSRVGADAKRAWRYENVPLDASG
jgi:hypothetical protein